MVTHSSATEAYQESKMKCKICERPSPVWTKIQLLRKYDVQFYSCEFCGFIQTEEPYWLDEAYSSVIAKSDIGLIGRNIKYSKLCSVLIPYIFKSFVSGLDFGGGNGMFVRMMRDLGFDFYWQDKFSPNQFADGFEFTEGHEYSLVTAFELFEHLVNPLDEIAEMFGYADTIIFSTRILPQWKITPSTWWYFTPDTGQHISLYSRESLELIANKFGVHFSSNGVSLHVLSRRAIPSVILKAISFSPFADFLSAVVNINRRSLLEDDYFGLTGRKLS